MRAPKSRTSLISDGTSAVWDALVSFWNTPTAMNDPDEPESRRAILDGTLGKGRYVYTTLSIFRQVPAGVSAGLR